MSLFKDKFQEMEENQDVMGLIQLLEDPKWQNRYRAILSLIRIKDKSATEDVKRTLDYENQAAGEIGVKYLRLNNAIPETMPENMNIYSYNIKNPYISLGKVSASSGEFENSDYVKKDLNSKLKEKAAKLSANAVISVRYNGIKASGLAVLIKDIDAVEKTDYVSVAPSTISLLVLPLALLNSYIESNGYYLILLPFLLFMIYVIKNGGNRNKSFKIIFSLITVYSGVIWVWFILTNGFVFKISFLAVTSIFLLFVISFLYDYKMEIKYYS